MRTPCVASVLLCALSGFGCGQADPPEATGTPRWRVVEVASAPASARIRPVADGGAVPKASAAPASSSEGSSVDDEEAPREPGEAEASTETTGEATGSCPDGMALVHGAHCRFAQQECLEEARRPEGDPDPNRCLRFAEPSVCTDTHGPPRQMNFCMDRFEYPNEPGQVPLTLVDWGRARSLCASRGKRLCTEAEFTFACEGEEMRPYATGFERPVEQCNIDQPYRKPRRQLLPHHLCMTDPRCAREFERLDARRPATPNQCVSPFGIFDLNGNVNEWVDVPWKRAPHRAAIKGGWWGPVRSRCRPIVTSHDERYVGYEVGFRCCQDPE